MVAGAGQERLLEAVADGGRGEGARPPEGELDPAGVQQQAARLGLRPREGEAVPRHRERTQTAGTQFNTLVTENDKESLISKGFGSKLQF